MRKVLFVIQGTRNFGGVAKFTTTVHNALLNKDYSFDYLCVNESPYALVKKYIEASGGKIYQLNTKTNTINSLLVYKKVKSFLAKKQYDIIHINSGNVAFNTAVSMAAHNTLKTKIIVHSHAKITKIITKLVKKVIVLLLPDYANRHLACSDAAAKSAFSQKITRDQRYTVIKNGIDTKKFEFDKKQREITRKKLGLHKNEFLITHIGRFEPVKNHTQIINIFNEIKNIKTNYKLLLIGTGPLKESIFDLVKSYRLEDSVIYIPKTNDIAGYLNASDYFIFPSTRQEGFGIVALEAQCSGLPTFIPDYLPEEIRVTELAKTIKSNEPKKWAEEIINYNHSHNRIEFSKKLKQRGFDISNLGETMDQIYENTIQKKVLLFSRYGRGVMNAGPKAKIDIIKITKSAFEAKVISFVDSPKKISIKNILNKLTSRLVPLMLASKETIAIVQCPFLNNPKFLKKYYKTIALVHDLDGLRNNNNQQLEEEVKTLSLYDFVIAHNQKMKSLLVQKGLNSKKIKTINLFDYIVEEDAENYSRNDESKTTVAYAGNLNKQKSPFIYQLDPHGIKFELDLFGIGINNDINKAEKYKGAFDPDILPLKINQKLGLIWDGNHDESDSEKSYKNYTRYNNPHKLSCYLAAGVPVIAWRKAAIADFILKNQIGYTISNIYDINSLNLDSYDAMKKNARMIGSDIKKGLFTVRVIKEILKDI